MDCETDKVMEETNNPQRRIRTKHHSTELCRAAQTAWRRKFVVKISYIKNSGDYQVSKSMPQGLSHTQTARLDAEACNPSSCDMKPGEQELGSALATQ